MFNQKKFLQIFIMDWETMKWHSFRDTILAHAVLEFARHSSFLHFLYLNTLLIHSLRSQSSTKIFYIFTWHNCFARRVSSYWQLGKIVLKWIFMSVQLRLGGIVTCYNNNIDKYGTKGGGKGCRGEGPRGGAPVGVQGAKPLPGGSRDCAPRIVWHEFDWI